LTTEQKAEASWLLGDNRGWGFGVSVITRRDDVASSPGRFGWDGGYGTSWANDTNTGLIGLMFTQSVAYYVGSNQFHDFWSGAFASIGVKPGP